MGDDRPTTSLLFQVHACQAWCSGTRAPDSLGMRFKLISPRAKFPPTLVRAATTPPSPTRAPEDAQWAPGRHQASAVCVLPCPPMQRLATTSSAAEAMRLMQEHLLHPGQRAAGPGPWAPAAAVGMLPAVRCSRGCRLQQLLCRSPSRDYPISDSSFARCPSVLLGNRLSARLPTSRRGAGATQPFPAPVPAISPHRSSLLRSFIYAPHCQAEID